jgi:hypothetical protein
MALSLILLEQLAPGGVGPPFLVDVSFLDLTSDLFYSNCFPHFSQFAGE